MPNLIPKIDVIIDTSLVSEALAAGIQVVAVLAPAASGTDDQVVVCRDPGDAELAFGLEDYTRGRLLTGLVKKAFEGGIDLATGKQVGASIVYAVKVGGDSEGTETGVGTTALVAGATTVTLGSGQGAQYSTGDYVRFADANGAEFQRVTVSGDVLTLEWALQRDYLALHTIHVITMPLAADYASALAALAPIPEVGMIVLGDNDQTIIDELETHCQDAEDDEKWRIGFVGHNPDASISALTTIATNTDSKFVTQIACTPTLTDGNGVNFKVHSSLLAAAMAGKFSARVRPIINPDAEILKGFTGVSTATSWTNAQQQQLIAGGVTPIVLKLGELEIVRWVTTFLTLNALPSTLYQDGAEYEVTRYLGQQLSVLIASNFKQKANTQTVRNSIANFIDNKLKQYQSDGILDDEVFIPTVVIVDPLDVHGVIETVSFKPVAPLHFHTIILKRIL